MQGQMLCLGMMYSMIAPQAPPGAAAQDSSAAAPPAEPVKAPQEPMVRDVTAALPLPAEVDELMREHCRFLYREGTARFMAPVSFGTKEISSASSLMRREYSQSSLTVSRALQQ